MHPRFNRGGIFVPFFLFLGLNRIFMFKNDVQMPVGFDWGKMGVFSLYGVLVGFLLMLIGGIWMIGQVIADQSGGAEEKRYRDVER